MTWGIEYVWSVRHLIVVRTGHHGWDDWGSLSPIRRWPIPTPRIVD